MINILLSTYNGERYLQEQLDSILAQTYTDWHLYVRDDGSKDATCHILESYAKKDARITIVQNGMNLGAKRSFMHLLESYGEADYMAFADQDDVWDANKLEVCLKAIQEAEQHFPDKPIIVHTDLRVVDEQLHMIAPSFWRYCNIRPDLLDNNIHYMAICTSVTGCTMLINRAARACAIPMEVTAYMHDLWIAQRTLMAGGLIVPIYQTTMDYRQHESNVEGATAYSWRSTWKQRRKEVEQVYERAHPTIFANKLEFWGWKTIYLFHRLLKPRKHD